MEKDHLEKRYRKSPGRQYGYDYDPLRSQSGSSSQAGSSRPSHSGTALIQRPDMRRTRQLMRQSIIASKRDAQDEAEIEEQWSEPEPRPPVPPPDPRARARTTRRFSQPTSRSPQDQPGRRSVSRHLDDRYAPPRMPATRELTDIEDRPRERYGLEDHGQYDAPVDPYEAYVQEPLRRPQREIVPRTFVHEDEMDLVDDQYDFAAPPATPRHPSNKLVPARTSRRTRQIVKPEQADADYIYEEDEELPSGLRPVKKNKVTRRGLLLGAGALAIGGGAIYAVSQAPHTPSTSGSPIVDNSKEIFNRGADDARTEFLTAVHNLEGFSLEGAIAAAKLLQGTYDVIVSPVIHVGTEISGDFLKAMLTAMRNARGSLAQIYQDNASLASIQRVLESWVAQVDTLPKQLDAITQTDLDGAQAYLRALQRKLDDEKKRLHTTPTPVPKNATATPKKSPTPKPQP